MIKTSKIQEKSKAPELTIDELTALYVQFNEQMKAAKANADRYKALLVGNMHRKIVVNSTANY